MLPHDDPALADVELGDLGAALATVTLADLIGVAHPDTNQALTEADLTATLGDIDGAAAHRRLGWPVT